MSASPEVERAQPIGAAERIDVLDVLRGFAVYGILLYNVRPLSGHDVMPPGVADISAADRAVDFAIEFLVQGKFYSLFSFLFGAVDRCR